MSTSVLSLDGERFIPGSMTGSIALEHWHRYAFALGLCEGKDVLDIACGEGYGSALLAKRARSVVGADVSAEVVEHARAAYCIDNLKYVRQDCRSLDFPGASFDLVVSFETIEHIAEQDQLLQHISRVLRPQGLLVISSPNRTEYNALATHANEHHIQELESEELLELLGRHFQNISLLGQRVVTGSLISCGSPRGHMRFASLKQPELVVDSLPSPVYSVALASNGSLPVVHESILEQSIEELLSQQKSTQFTEAFVLRTLADFDSVALKQEINSDWYLSRNSDVVRAKVDPVKHWLEYGYAEGRLPSADSMSLAKALSIELKATHKTPLGNRFALEAVTAAIRDSTSAIIAEVEKKSFPTLLEMCSSRLDTFEVDLREIFSEADFRSSEAVRSELSKLPQAISSATSPFFVSMQEWATEAQISQEESMKEILRRVEEAANRIAQENRVVLEGAIALHAKGLSDRFATFDETFSAISASIDFCRNSLARDVSLSISRLNDGIDSFERFSATYRADRSESANDFRRLTSHVEGLMAQFSAVRDSFAMESARASDHRASSEAQAAEYGRHLDTVNDSIRAHRDAIAHFGLVLKTIEEGVLAASERRVELESEVQAMKGSVSWALTKPLRWLWRAIHR